MLPNIMLIPCSREATLPNIAVTNEHGCIRYHLKTMFSIIIVMAINVTGKYAQDGPYIYLYICRTHSVHGVTTTNYVFCWVPTGPDPTVYTSWDTIGPVGSHGMPEVSRGLATGVPRAPVGFPWDSAG